MSPRVFRRPELLLSDDKRVIPRYLDFGHPPRVRSIARRVLKIPRRRVKSVLGEISEGFSYRHRDLMGAFEENFRNVAPHLRNVSKLTRDQKLLIGAYFTMEYSIESAALFNPSIVPHPDQSGVPDGGVRFLMSLRATGEGHVSSIVFRRGVIQPGGELEFDPPPRYAFSARPLPDKKLDKNLFIRKMREFGVNHDPDAIGLGELPDPFRVSELRSLIEKLKRSKDRPPGYKRLSANLMWLANANYELRFPDDAMPAETVIFPATSHESRGMEDLRLVQFVDDDGEVTYYGTYTAFDGFRVHPMLLETRDFHRFHVHPLSGRYARNKGMALFPRKVGNYYLMVSRHDGENIFLMRSQDLHVWNSCQKIQTPTEDWELVQLGNCGSPIETPRGWILLTHGVGPMRRYCIGAVLLDLDDPFRVIGRLRRPILEPTRAEREGYVPNVVYSCGSLLHNGRLVIPYAMSDARTAFAVVSVKRLVERLLEDGP